MGLFFNKERDNKFLNDQKSVYDTEGEANNQVKQKEDYNKFVFQKKDYSHVPKYRAHDEGSVGVVVDKDDFGYGTLNSDVETVHIQKENLHENLLNIINNVPLDDLTNKNNKSIYDENINSEIKKDEPIEILEVGNDNDFVVSSSDGQNVDDVNKLSIFGGTDEMTNTKVYEVKLTPAVEKIDIIDVDLTPQQNNILNEDGKKVCSYCGAPSEPDALECFLCKNKF